MTRILFHLACAFSLLLCLTTAWLWVRSHWVMHILNVGHGRWRVGVLEDVGAPNIWIFHDDQPVDEPWEYLCTRRGGAVTSYKAPMATFLGFDVDWSPADRSDVMPNTIQSDRLVLVVPYWAVLVLGAILPLRWWLLYRGRWRRAKRALAGLCVRCGYDLRASPGRCPECGAPSTGVG